MKRLATVLVGIACTGCAGVRVAPTSPVLEDEGALYVYLAALPPEANRDPLRFTSITALRDDKGREVLTLSLGLGDEQAVRERLVATGRLPPGQYTGLELEIASLDGNSVVAMPLAIVRRRAAVVSLQLDLRRSIGADFAFHPEFTAAIPERLPTGLIALASAPGSNAVAQFDKRTGHVVAMIVTGKAPRGLVLDQARRRAYVACSGEDAVEVIDLLEGRVIERLALLGGDAPEELALTPDGEMLLAANTGSNTVSLIDARTLLETQRVNVGDGPQGLVIDASGRRAFVFNTASDNITVIDIPRAAVAGTIATDVSPFRGQLNRRGDRLYVAHRTSPYVSVLDTTTAAVLRRVYVGSEVTALKVDLQTDRVLIARRGSDAIDLYDPLSFLPVDSIRVGADVEFMAIDGESNTLLAVLPQQGQVQIVPLVSKRTAATLDVGGSPYAVVTSGER